MRIILLNNMSLLKNLLNKLWVVLWKWSKYFFIALCIRILAFIVHFLTEFFPFFLQSKKFVKQRFSLWLDWNFKKYWGFLRILFFFLTLLSFAKPIYFVLRWIAFTNFFILNVIFMLWRAFFLELFSYLFNWTFRYENPIKVRMVLLDIYIYFSPLCNSLSLFIARGFGLHYFDYFVSYLDSLSTRNWDKWLFKKIDKVMDFFDETIYLCQDLYEWYDWYKVEILWWTPYYWHQTKRLVKKSFYLSLFYFKRFLKFLRKWFSLRSFRFYKKILSFYFFTKYGRILIKTQISVYFTVFSWILKNIWYIYIKIECSYYLSKIMHYFRYYLLSQVLIYYCVKVFIYILGFFDIVADVVFWFFCESIFFTLFFKHIFNFFLWIFFFFYNKIYKRFYRIKKFYYKFYYKLLMSLQHIPFWNYILKRTFVGDIFSLDKEMVDMYLWRLFTYAKKKPFKKAVYDENNKISFVEVTNHIEKEHLIVQHLKRLRSEWEWEGEIPPDHLMWLEGIRQELIIEEINERERKEKEEALKLKEAISKKLAFKKEEAEIRGYTISSLNDYFEKKAKN